MDSSLIYKSFKRLLRLFESHGTLQVRSFAHKQEVGRNPSVSYPRFLQRHASNKVYSQEANVPRDVYGCVGVCFEEETRNTMYKVKRKWSMKRTEQGEEILCKDGRGKAVEKPRKKRRFRFSFSVASLVSFVSFLEMRDTRAQLVLISAAANDVALAQNTWLESLSIKTSQ